MIREDLERATAEEKRHLSAETIAALRRLGGVCDGCAIAVPERRAVAILSGRALCGDCCAERRMDKLAARIHRPR